MKLIISTDEEEFTIEVEYGFVTHRVPRSKEWMIGHSHQFVNNWAEEHKWRIRTWSASELCQTKPGPCSNGVSPDQPHQQASTQPVPPSHPHE